MVLPRAPRALVFAGLLVPLAGLSGCLMRPRPPEITALEKLRSEPTLSDADRRAFDLLAAADDLLVRAQGEWDARHDDRARRDGLVGQIKMKMALAIIQAEHAQARIAELDTELALAQDEEARVDQALAIAEEEAALLERLRTARAAADDARKALAAQIEGAKKQAATDKQRLAEQIASQTQRAEAIDSLRKAELALRNADTVEAGTYAKAKYAPATTMLQEAHKQFDAGNWAEVIARATLAAGEADGAAALARPLYEKAAATMTERARDRALEADATGLPGVATRLERQDDVQRLVLVLSGLFEAGKTVLAAKGASTLDAVRELLARYPTYSVQVTAYPDGMGKPAEQVATSLARANAVFWSLVKRGIEPKRMTVDARAPVPGEAGPAAERPHDAGVELTLLYHIDGGT